MRERADPQLVLNEAAYSEVRRLTSKGGEELEAWRKLARSLGKMSEADLRRELASLSTRLAWDVAGISTRACITSHRARCQGFSARSCLRGRRSRIFRESSPSSVRDAPAPRSPRSTSGSSSRARGSDFASSASAGTLVYVPTHLSNLDSVVFGFALERAGLSPATYGAGKNLFTNPVLSFFMHNLGAYRVDRRLKHALYKDVLKAYSCVLIERGYHSLFFPGGTRSRSGGVERRLKLGLAGTGIEAFARRAERGATQQVFFVPATINYLLTLEAETLIDDFLQEEGKARYIIEDDESTRMARITSFMQKLLGLDARVRRSASRSRSTCFGNAVDATARSYEAHGRQVDCRELHHGGRRTGPSATPPATRSTRASSAR